VGGVVGFGGLGGLGVVGWRLSHNDLYVGEVGGVADENRFKDVGVVLTMIDRIVAIV
jgi:hypothetical protein